MTDLSPAELEYVGATAEEIEEANRGVRTLNGTVLSRLRDLLDRRRLRKKQREESGRDELGGRSWQQYMHQVRGQRREREQQLRADQKVLDAMTPAQYDAWKRQRDFHPVNPYPFAKREVIALQDAETENRKAINRERERREQLVGLPKAQRLYGREVSKIEDACRAAEAEAEQIKRAARERKRAALAELGECPTMESLEAMPA